jgi:phosphoglycolate phosphatase
MIFEVVNCNPAPGRVRVALFDFDGTVSLLRSGWQQIMVEMMTELLPRVNGESDAATAAMARELVHRTNGQPTLLQMQALADLVRARGGTALDAATYKEGFLDRLWNRVRPRLAAIQSGAVGTDGWQVPGVKLALEALCGRRVTCYLASGTDQSAVCAETAALGLEKYFAGIYGATSDVENSTKTAIFKLLAHAHNLRANELVTFGDGVEEIRLANESGWIGVGLARDESNPEVIDPDQRARLIAAGADVIIGDFRTYDRVIKYLFEPPG